MNIERPKVNDEIKLAAAIRVAAMMEDADAETIANAYKGYMDGYELAKELDRLNGWEITAQDVEILDCMSSYVDDEHEKACKKWFEENNIQPPLEIGTRIKNGLITGICEHRAGTYLVKENDIPDSETGNKRLLVRFEEAVAAL